MAGVETQREWCVGKACCEGTERGQTCADVSKRLGRELRGPPSNCQKERTSPTLSTLGLVVSKTVGNTFLSWVKPSSLWYFVTVAHKEYTFPTKKLFNVLKFSFQFTARLCLKIICF